MESAIIVDDVSVRFRPVIDRSPTLRRLIGGDRAREVEEVDALRNVSFEIPRGEAYAILGRNGAGKSTLLRVLARTMRPNSGTVTVNGRTSTLLQLGVGFKPALSGRRNIYLGGLAHGLTIAQIDELFDDIVEYAELQDAIDRPLKTYSSGMFARLGFSISMHLEPDILLLDEVLAVGDGAFQEKSVQSMRGLLARAGTIIFVSHSLRTIENFCDSALWLHECQVRMTGTSGEVVEAYRVEMGIPA